MPPFIIIFSRFHNTKKHKFTLETSFVMVYKKYCQFLNVGSGVYAIKDFFSNTRKFCFPSACQQLVFCCVSDSLPKIGDAYIKRVYYGKYRCIFLSTYLVFNIPCHHFLMWHCSYKKIFSIKKRPYTVLIGAFL